MIRKPVDLVGKEKIQLQVGGQMDGNHGNPGLHDLTWGERRSLRKVCRKAKLQEFWNDVGFYLPSGGMLEI